MLNKYLPSEEVTVSVYNRNHKTANSRYLDTKNNFYGYATIPDHF